MYHNHDTHPSLLQSRNSWSCASWLYLVRDRSSPLLKGFSCVIVGTAIKASLREVTSFLAVSTIPGMLQRLLHKIKHLRTIHAQHYYIARQSSLAYAPLKAKRRIAIIRLLGLITFLSKNALKQIYQILDIIYC